MCDQGIKILHNAAQPGKVNGVPCILSKVDGHRHPVPPAPQRLGPRAEQISSCELQMCLVATNIASTILNHDLTIANNEQMLISRLTKSRIPTYLPSLNEALKRNTSS